MNIGKAPAYIRLQGLVLLNNGYRAIRKTTSSL